MTTSPQNRVPSLRTRQPRCSTRPSVAGLEQQAQRESGAAVLLGVEHREAAPDRLVGGVALDPLGAEVPGW